MKRLLATTVLFGGLLLSRLACADRVTLRDGTVLEGVVVSKEANEIRLLPDADRTRHVMVIPRNKIAEIKEMIGPDPATAAATAPASDSKTRPRSDESFFSSMAKLAVGISPDLGDPATMDPARQALWQNIVVAETQKSSPDLLNSLTALANACGQDSFRLDALARRHVDKTYGQWLAPLRWESIRGNYHTGRFELKDVTEIERTALIGILRQETEPALNPLISYFPKPRDPAARPIPGQPPIDPLAGITINNALDVKDKALYASAVLLAQLRLEPEMPFVDRAFLSRQLVDVRSALARAINLEPLARRAAQSPEQAQKVTEEINRREAARQALRNPPPIDPPP